MRADAKADKQALMPDTCAGKGANDFRRKAGNAGIKQAHNKEEGTRSER